MPADTKMVHLISFYAADHNVFNVTLCSYLLYKTNDLFLLLFYYLSLCRSDVYAVIYTYSPPGIKYFTEAACWSQSLFCNGCSCLIFLDTSSFNRLKHDLRYLLNSSWIGASKVDPRVVLRYENRSHSFWSRSLQQTIALNFSGFTIFFKNSFQGLMMCECKT